MASGAQAIRRPGLGHRSLVHTRIRRPAAQGCRMIKHRRARNSADTGRSLGAITLVGLLAGSAACGTDGAAAQEPGTVPRHAASPAATPDPSTPHRFVFPRAHADLQTLVVTTTRDVFDAADLAAPGTGRLSLREAF